MPRRPSAAHAATGAAPSLRPAVAPVPPQRARAVEAFVAALLANGAAAVLLHTHVLTQLGLSVGDFVALDLLARGGPLTAGELGAATGLASASVTGLVDRLEARGVARRVRDPADARRVRVEARSDGLRRVGEAFAAAGLDLEGLAAPYTDAELTLATEVLQQVSARVHAALVPRQARHAGRRSR